VTARVAKHDHIRQVISHTEDWGKVLVNCKILSCTYTEVLLTKRTVKPDVTNMRHLCCG